MNSKSSNNQTLCDKLSQRIKAEALSLGFSACGISHAEPVDGRTAENFKHWLGEGLQAEMNYMSNYLDKRLDPCLLMEGAKSIISVALNYYPARRIPDDQYQIALYAYGRDYHDVMKEKLQQLAIRAGLTRYRAFCDTAPVLERYWAVKAGLGWTGRHHQLIIPHAGSTFFLGELFTDMELEYDTPMPSRCGDCHRCIEACPTQALQADRGLDSRRCLSYLTIENRGDIPSQFHHQMGNCIYGCDRCLQACPWHRFASPATETQLQPTDELLAMTREEWSRITPDDYRRIFKGSAVKRAKYEGLVRNIRIADKNGEQ
jgi:epoxyqueuosine reductase